MNFSSGLTCYVRRLIAQVYRVFVEVKLPEILEEIPLARERNVSFQHDASAARFALQVLEHLSVTYSDRWIGRGWPVVWPPRSPDLTPVGLFPMR